MKTYPYIQNGWMPVEMVRIPADPARTITAQSVIAAYPQLAAAGKHMYVSPIQAPEGGTPAYFYRTGRRSGTTYNSAKLDLQAIGFTDTPTNQTFREARKGPGQPFHQSKAVYNGKNAAYDQLREYISHKKGLPEMLTRLLYPNIRLREASIITAADFDYRRPEGAVSFNEAEHSVAVTDELVRNRTGLKIAPTVYGYQFPAAVEEAIEQMPRGNGYRAPVASGQTCRYMPSDIRAMGLRPEHVWRFSLNQTELRQILDTIYGDVVPYFSIFNQYFAVDGKDVIYPQVSDIHTLPNADELGGHRLLSKDQVVAATGLYFVDLESLHLHVRKRADAFENELGVYASGVLNDFFRVCYNFEEGIDRLTFRTRSSEQRSRTVMEKLVEKINQDARLTAQYDGTQITLDITTPAGTLQTSAHNRHVYNVQTHQPL